MRFLYAAVLASMSLAALACGSTVINDDDGTGGSGASECDFGPPPGGDGWCPPSWECIDGEWQDTAGACPEPECPASEPFGGVACVMEGQDCTYEGGWDCEEELSDVTYRCIDGVFVQLSNFCSPPPECPDALPIAGSDCTGWDNAFDCYYTVPNGCGVEDDSAWVYCDGSQWVVDMKSTCNDCAYGDAASCEANAACRWLVPGCGENPLLAEGCAPIADCTPDSCTGGATCSSYDADPCWNSPCDACSSPVSICEMIFEPNE